jgi:TfoX/Sxy family transcriptional regulator of competence genes
MAFDEKLADRVRDLIGAEPGLTEKRMFGGLAMLLDGNMAVAVRGRGGLMIRVTEADEEKSLAEGAELAVMRDRPMSGWIVVDEPAVATKAALGRWVKRGIAGARALPPK